MEKVEFLKFLPLSYQPPTSDVMEVKLELGLDGFVGMLTSQEDMLLSWVMEKLKFCQFHGNEV